MKENKKTIIIVVSILSVIIISLIILSLSLMPDIPSYANSTNMTLSQKFEVEHNLSTTPITRPVYDKGFFYVTPNYTSFYNKKGEMLWNEIFNLNNVTVVQDGEIISTAQYNVSSSTVYVFNASGLMYNVKPNQKILKHSVNKNGFLSLIFEEGNGYQIQVYNADGDRVLTYTFAEKNSIPVDVSISANDKYLAIPFFNYDGLTPVSKTMFLYLDKTDSAANMNGDAIFAGFDLDNTIPFMSKFIGNNLYLVTDKTLAMYEVVNGVVSDPLTMDINNYIKDIDIVDGQYILLSVSEKINSNSTFEPDTVIIYDLKGNLVAQTDPIPQLNFVTASPNGFLAESNNNITYYNFKCSPVFSFSLEQTINDAYVIDKDLDTIITTSKTNIYEVVRVRGDE